MMDYNFQGYDIGKLLMEVLYKRHEHDPGYDFQTLDNLPSEEDTVDFIKYYLAGHLGNFLRLEEVPDVMEALKKLFSSENEMRETIDRLVREAQVGIMVSGYYSCYLGMRIGKIPEFAINFVKFAMDGFEIYKEFKKRLFGQ